MTKYKFNVIDALVYLTGIFSLLLPACVTLMNYEIPDESEVILLHAKIIKISSRSPHVYLENSSGNLISAEFPVRITYGGVEDRSIFSMYEQDMLASCGHVDIKGDFLKYFPIKRLRIWQIKCSQGNFEISNEKIEKGWLEKRKFDVELQFLIFFLIMMLYFFSTNYHKRRG